MKTKENEKLQHLAFHLQNSMIYSAIRMRHLGSQDREYQLHKIIADFIYKKCNEAIANYEDDAEENEEFNVDNKNILENTIYYFD